MKIATFAGGCFWCLQGPFDALDGVIQTEVGYTKDIDKVKVIQVEYNPNKISYPELLDVFWRQIDPTDPDGQFADRGEAYQTAIYYHDNDQKELAEKSRDKLADSGRFSDPIVTEIRPASKFTPAENYHQEFYKKHPTRYNFFKHASGRAPYLKDKWTIQKSI